MKFKVYLLFLSTLLLCACGEGEFSVQSESVDEVSSNIIDLSSYPIGVQNGDISLAYYEILNEARIKFDELHEDIEVAKTKNDNYESVKEVYRKYLLYINGIRTRNLNDNEKEIDKYFSSFLYNMEHNAEYRIKHIDSKSDLDNSVAKDYYADAKNDLIMMFETMEKFKLFHEK